MRNLIVCCDGTWNTPDQTDEGVPVPTNVVRLFNAVADKDDEGGDQLKYYHPGVGSEGNWWEKVAGGGVGLGLTKNVLSAYKWIGVNYQENDRIFLFGFSRGAYTVRSVAGMIASVGLLDLSELPDNELWKRVATAQKRGYRKRAERKKWAKDWAFHGAGPNRVTKVFFVGVWDTVGALGVPNNMGILNLLDNVDNFSFHDTKLNKHILNARHAVAMDEDRASFAPTLWNGVARRKTVKQIWFPGAHSDVGGGYKEIGLADGALKWMIDEAQDLGLTFNQNIYKQIKPNHHDALHDSNTGFYKHLTSQPRPVPMLTPSNAAVLHQSVLKRIADPPIAQAPYHQTVELKPGEFRDLPVYAIDPWGKTEIYLERGARYLFTASGQWMDRSIKCGPGGADDGKFYIEEIFYLAGSILGKFEGLFKKISKNEEADFKGTRREEDKPWFALVGAIANGGLPDADGKSSFHETFLIGEGCERRVSKPGYLYCFANDAWNFYGNNRGQVMLRVKRLK